MIACCFLSEPPTTPPRSIRREVAEAAREVCLRVDEVMECVVEALIAFPDAYRAVMRVMKERRARKAEAERAP